AGARTTLQQLTRDHTMVQHFVDVGLLSAEDAEEHPNSHILSRALGSTPHVEPEIAVSPHSLAPGDRILLCSDGLSKMLSTSQIQSLLRAPSSPQEIAESLIEAANRAGGEDNITALIYMHDPTGTEQTTLGEVNPQRKQNEAQST
ncbi:MAG: SpoIIE family protein phosphatase, partial [Myxococcota bacterium]